MVNKEVSAEARKSALESDYAALYAVAGLTDALAEALKGALAESQQKASKRITELQNKRPELSKQAKTSAEELRTFVITLPEQFKNLPETTKARIAELQRQANDLLAQATGTYGDFVGRGKQAVDEARTAAHDRSGKAREGSCRRPPPRPPRRESLPLAEASARKGQLSKDRLSVSQPLTPHPLARAPRRAREVGREFASPRADPRPFRTPADDRSRD